MRPAPGLLQIGHKSGKWQWLHNFPTWHHCNFFLTWFVPFVNFSYWSKFHFSITTGSGVMTIYFFKGLTRISEIGNALVWVLPDIWRLGLVRDTNFGTNASNRMLVNTAKCQSYRFYRLWVIKGNPTQRLWERGGGL